MKTCAKIILLFLLAACGNPSSESSASTFVATDAPALEPAPAFVRSDEIAIRPGDWSVIAVADLNEDGETDVVTTSISKFGIGLLLGQGDGTFVAGPDIEAAASDYVRTDDLDGDGHIDLIGAGEQLAVLLGKGDGTFAPPVYYPGGENAKHAEINLFGLVIADMNGDNIPDLISANWGASRLAVLFGRGDGTFESAMLYPCRYCLEVAAADMDGDADVDIATSSFKIGQDGLVFVYMNDGRGLLSEPVSYNPRGNAHAIALGDLNGDGTPDVITGDDASYRVSVLIGRGAGTLAQAQTYPAGNTHTIALADFNADGNLDLLSGSYTETTVRLYLGAGDGTLIETQGIDSGVANGLAVTDLNGDGKLDLVLAIAGGGHQIVSVYLQQ